MPHLIIEYTKNVQQNIDVKDLFSALHQVLAAVGGVNIENCKSRAIRRDDYHIGNGETDNAFVHLELSMLEGRSIALKQKIGQEMLKVLREHYASSLAQCNLQITVQVKDIDRPAYFKIPQGTLTRIGDSG